MFNYPSSEPQQDMLDMINRTDEAMDYIGTNPLDDPEHPLSEKEKRKKQKQVYRLFAKIRDKDKL